MSMCLMFVTKYKCNRVIISFLLLLVVVRPKHNGQGYEYMCNYRNRGREHTKTQTMVVPHS